MPEIITAVMEILKSIIQKIPTPSEQVSAAILMFITVGLVAFLLILIARINSPNGDGKIENIKIAEEELTKKFEELFEKHKEKEDLRAELSKLRDAVSKAASDQHTPNIEKLYLNLNGMANAGLMLCISLLLYEFLTLSGKIEALRTSGTSASRQFDRLVQSVLKVVSNEISLLMFTVVAALVLSAAVLAISHLREGKPIELINRAFLISLVICAAAFGLFISASEGMLS
jgi:hypothetical protein